jgi:molybdate transport system ATP-binding protein
LVEGAVSDAAGLDARIVVSRGEGFSADIGLEITQGHTVALLGPNGAGKSSAVLALAGLLPLDAGRIVLNGRTLDDPAAGVFVPPEQRHIGVVFQDYLLFPHLSVAHNVAFGLRDRRRADALDRASAWLRRLDLDELADRKPRDLSGGQAQRVALARALITEPDLLLLDEPLAALDVSTRAELRRTLADYLGRFPGPRLLITHEPAEAFLLADEIHVVENGTITQVGTADDIRLRPRTRYIADLAGSNLISGSAARGLVMVGEHRLHVGDTTLVGAVLATIHPRAVSLHRRRPEGSPRNVWETTVRRIEHYGDRVRLQTGDPLPLAVEVTPGAEKALALREGSWVWVSIKATEIGVEAD